MRTEDWQTNTEYYRDIFWKTIDEWADPSRADEGAVFIENIPNHEEMLAECQRYTSWNPESAFPLVSGRKRHERYWDTTSNKYEEIPEDREGTRGFAIPTEEDFPTIYEFLKRNEHQYFRPEISKLGAGGHIFPHAHSSPKFVEEWIFNLCLNFPDKCKFAVYPLGVIPFQAGDIYKLRGRNLHSVINESDEPRYHIMLRTKEYIRDYEKLFNEQF